MGNNADNEKMLLNFVWAYCAVSILYVTEFCKTEQEVTFDIIYYICVYLRPSRLYYWFNKRSDCSEKISITDQK